jgi:hypothetical protein
MGGALLQTHTTLELSLPPLVSFTIFSFIWSKARNFIGENFWYDQYEGFFYVLALIISYVIKLEQSSYVIHLAYETLCLIFQTYMFRPRSKLR